MSLKMNKKLFHISSLLFPIVILLLVSSCAPTEKAAEDTPSAATAGPYQPAWFKDARLVADSTGFSTCATSLASDSLSAFERSEKATISKLKKGLVGHLEKERKAMLDEKGSDSYAGNRDFIMSLRKAEEDFADYASLTQKEAVSAERAYRGFSCAAMSTEQLDEWLEHAFRHQPGYYKAFSKWLEK